MEFFLFGVYILLFYDLGLRKWIFAIYGRHVFLFVLYGVYVWAMAPSRQKPGIFNALCL